MSNWGLLSRRCGFNLKTYSASSLCFRFPRTPDAICVIELDTQLWHSCGVGGANTEHLKTFFWHSCWLHRAWFSQVQASCKECLKCLVHYNLPLVNCQTTFGLPHACLFCKRWRTCYDVCILISNILPPCCPEETCRSWVCMETPAFSNRRDCWTAPTSIKSTRETRRSTSKPESFSFDRQQRLDSVFVLTVVVL